MQAAQPPDVAHPRLCVRVSILLGRDAVLRVPGETPREPHRRSSFPGLDPRLREAADLADFLDHAADVDNVVQRLQDTAVI